MTHRVPKSKVLDEIEFDKAVKVYANDMTAWANHINLVRQGQAQYYPSPTTHADIMASVRADSREDGKIVEYIPDYELFDDSPAPPQTEELLLRKKQFLIQRIMEEEVMALKAVDPLSYGKRRLREIRYEDFLAKTTPRTEEEATFVADHDELKKNIRKIYVIASEMISEVEDLTSENIDQWVMRSFV